jgi:hypothetical protein
MHEEDIFGAPVPLTSDRKCTRDGCVGLTPGSYKTMAEGAHARRECRIRANQPHCLN